MENFNNDAWLNPIVNMPVPNNREFGFIYKHNEKTKVINKNTNEIVFEGEFSDCIDVCLDLNIKYYTENPYITEPVIETPKIMPSIPFRKFRVQKNEETGNLYVMDMETELPCYDGNKDDVIQKCKLLNIDFYKENIELINLHNTTMQYNDGSPFGIIYENPFSE